MHPCRFWCSPNPSNPPKLVEYFGKVLPYAMTGLLVVYALRNTPILTGSHGIPELIACAVITLLHLWKRNMLLSTAGGTAVYMLLIQLVSWCSRSMPGGESRQGWMRNPPPNLPQNRHSNGYFSPHFARSSSMSSTMRSESACGISAHSSRPSRIAFAAAAT